MCVIVRVIVVFAYLEFFCAYLCMLLFVFLCIFSGAWFYVSVFLFFCVFDTWRLRLILNRCIDLFILDRNNVRKQLYAHEHIQLDAHVYGCVCHCACMY